MQPHDADTPEDIDADVFEQDLFDEERRDEERERRGLMAALSGWSTSLTVHALLLALLTSIVLFQEQEIEPLPPIALQPQEAVERVDPLDPLERPDPETEVTIEVSEVDLKAVSPSELDLPEPVEDNEPLPEEELQEPAVTAGEISLEQSAIFMSIAAGGPASSGGGGDMFSNRPSGRDGPPRGVPVGRIKAVEAALRWFKRHQSPDGSWDVDGYADNCRDAGPRCEPGRAHTQSEVGDVACTGYALLCFLGSGYDHKTPNKYRGTVQAGLDWLRDRAADRGDGGIALSPNIYAQAVAAKAVIEAYGMTGDPRLRRLAQGVTDRLVALQNTDAEGYGLGWNYKPSATRNDASVSGWVIMALKSAAGSGLDVGDSMQGAKRYVREAWCAMNPGWEQIGSEDASGFPYSWNPLNGEAKKEALAPAGALSAIFLGAHQGDPMLESLCNYIERKQTPSAYPCNTYYAYYNTFAMFQAGGERWQRWNRQVMPLLEQAQRRDGGCFDGSWDWQGTTFHGHDTGRLLSTAYNCLCLQVQWLYTRVEM